MNRKEQAIVHLRALKGSLAALKSQIQQATHDEIEFKTSFQKRFNDELKEYQQATKQIKELEKSIQHHDNNAKVLNDELEQVTNELADVKKQIHDEGKSMTDTRPLLDMRSAIQRLKTENKELDILVGVLYHEVTQARKGDWEDGESDDE